MTATEDWLKSVKDKAALRTSAGLSRSDKNPDEVVESRQIGSELGIPAQSVQTDINLFRRQAEQRKMGKQLSDAPLTTQWLSDVRNGEIASDDVENLTWFEKNLGAAGRAVGRGARRLSASDEMSRVMEAASKIEDIGKTYDQILAEQIEKVGQGVIGIDDMPPMTQENIRLVAEMRYDAIAGKGATERLEIIQQGAENLARANEIIAKSAEIPMSPAASGFRDQTLAQSENTFMGTLGAFFRDPIRGAAFIAETAAETLPVLAAASVATVVTRTPSVGALTMGGGSFLMENTNSAVEFLNEQGVDMSTPEAAMAALENEELMGAAQQRGLTRGIIIAAFDALSGGVAGQQIMQSPAGDALAQLFAQAFLGGGGEATAQLATVGEIDAREVVIEALAELATAPVEVLGVGGRRAADFFRRTAESDTTAEQLQAIDAVAEQSNLKSRDPEAFRDFLDRVGMGDVFVDPASLREYYQAKDVDVDTALSDLGIDLDQFAEAEMVGAPVPISQATYAAQISGTEDAAWFHENATIDPEGTSRSDAEEFNRRVADEMERAYEEAQEEVRQELEMRSSDQKVYDSVFSQLRAAGRTRDVAANEARVWSAFWRTMGERYGADPAELANSMGVTIRGPAEADPTRLRGQLDLMLNTLRKMGGKALRPRGQSVMEFVKDRGGVSDTGGDIAALDVPKGVIAETAQEAANRASQPALDGLPAERKGLGLDEMGRAVLEAGYFPDLVSGLDAQGQPVNEANLLIEALRQEASGDPVYLPNEGPDENMVALAAELSRLGIDLATVTNDDVAAALESGVPDANVFEQTGWQDVQVEVEMDDGSAETMPAGDVKSALDERIQQAKELLGCING